jgi:hypothetical protein
VSKRNFKLENDLLKIEKSSTIVIFELNFHEKYDIKLIAILLKTAAKHFKLIKVHFFLQKEKFNIESLSETCENLKTILLTYCKD